MARNLLRYSKQMMRQEFTAKRLQDSAQGFNPGSDVPKKWAPRVAPERTFNPAVPRSNSGRARCLSNVACGLTFISSSARRSRIPARRDQVYVINLFKPRILVCPGVPIKIPRPRDEGPTSPNALEQKATQRKAMSDRQRSLPVAGLAALPGRKTMRPFRALPKQCLTQG
jgi:hypothetical protein